MTYIAEIGRRSWYWGAAILVALMLVLSTFAAPAMAHTTCANKHHYHTGTTYTWSWNADRIVYVGGGRYKWYWYKDNTAQAGYNPIFMGTIYCSHG